MRLVSLMAAVVAVTAFLPAADAQTIELCRKESADNESIVSVPIRTLFVDGGTMPVDEMLCAVHARNENEPGIGQGEVTQFAPSPDGKYLAVAYSAEGHPSIEIVDLPALIRDRQYKSFSLVGAYPGFVSIDRWEAGALIVKSDMLLHVPLSSRAELFTTEAFSWDVRSGKLKPLSDALNEPVRYFSARLHDPETSNRIAAVWGLKQLDDQSAVPPLNQALAVEGDETVRQAMRDLLKRLTRTAQLINDCMSSNPETLRTQDIISAMINDQTICVIPPEGKWENQSWYRVEGSAGPPFHITLLAGGGDRVTHLSTSANGRFLAVQIGETGNTHVDIVELPSLMRSNNYKKVKTIYAFAGSVSIERWRDGDLELTSDVFLNHEPVPDKGEGDPANLPLFSPESFVWRSDNASVVSLSDGLQNPIRYYCAGLVTARRDRQRIALRGLALLKDRSALPCLESALSNNDNADIQAEIRRTMEAIITK